MRNESRMQAPPATPNNQPVFYRVPTDIVALPSKGIFYPPDHPWHNKKEVEVKYMTAKEEDIIMTKAYSERGITFQKVVESIAVDNIVGHEIISGDITAIIVNARKNAYGNEYLPMINCPHCENIEELSINLSDVGIKEVDPSNFNANGERVLTLPVSKAVVTLKLLRDSDEKEIEERKERNMAHQIPEQPLLQRLVQIITSVNDRSDIISRNAFVEAMPIKDTAVIRKAYSEMAPDIKYELSHTCSNCSNKIEGGLPFTGDFFRINI